MDSQAAYRNCVQTEAAGYERRNLFCWCSNKVICFFALLFAFALGLTLGAVFFLVILAALPAVIAFTVIMAVLIAATLIIRRCMCRKC
jgi:hypothetical protein